MELIQRLGFLFWLLLVSESITTDVFAETSRKPKIAFVIEANDHHTAYANALFYVRVLRDANELKQWDIQNGTNVNKHFKLLKGKNFSIKIPYYLSSTLPTSNGQKFVASLQKMLDTLAFDGAIAVTCDSNSEVYEVSACRLKYYDRQMGRFIATASKEFLAPIKDPREWATPMLLSLHEGLEAKKRNEEKRNVDELLALSEEKSSGLNFGGFSLGVGATQEPTKASHSGRFNLTNFSVLPQIISDQQRIGIAYGIGKIIDGSKNLRIEKFGLNLGVQSSALDYILWKFDLGAGLSRRSFGMEQQGTISGEQAYLMLRPGVAFQALKILEFGIHGSYVQYFGGIQRRTGDKKLSLSQSSFGIGFDLTLTLRSF